MSESFENWWRCFEWCVRNAKKSGVVISLKKWSAHVTDEFLDEILILWKRLFVLYTKCIQFLRNHLNFLAHAMWMKWWYHANFQPFQSSFEMLFNFRVLLLKIISKCMKNNKWSPKGLKNDNVALNGAFWTHKKSGVQIRFIKWNPFVTDEFPDEILILWKRLSVLYTKCIQFLP